MLVHKVKMDFVDFKVSRVTSGFKVRKVCKVSKEIPIL